MADKGPQSTSRSATKRLARAKIKPSDNGIKSSKGRKVATSEPSKTQEKKARKQKLTAVLIGVFAVIMALSMMLPSLSYIFGDNGQQEAEQQAAQQEQDAEADDTEEESETKSGMDLVDSNYQAVVVPLEEKLKENADDLATLLNLGNDYLSWAAEASSYATDEDAQAHVKELFDKAISYYDRYLELNDSNAVKVNRALAQLYSGDASAATAALEQLTKDAPDYGPAWSNLGYVYEMQYNQDAAKEAYEKAVEADADDEYGAKSFANRRLAAMAAASTDISDEANATGGTDATDTTATGPSALDQALGNTL